MSFSVHGQAVSRGIAIGRAVIVASSRMDVAHYFVTTEQVPAEVQALRRLARAARGPVMGQRPGRQGLQQRLELRRQDTVESFPAIEPERGMGLEHVGRGGGLCCICLKFRLEMVSGLHSCGWQRPRSLGPMA